MSILGTAVVIGLIGLVCGVLLAYIAGRFSVKEDPRVEEAIAVLPGANCGGCGFAGCASYAKAVITGDAPVDRCSAGGAAVVEKLSKLTGRSGSASEPKAAVVMCGGDNNAAKQKSVYNGITDCGAANIVSGGPKACIYGCLGLGTCARACPKNAIRLEGGIASVDPALCIGCGQCVSVCPRGLIRLVPRSHRIHVLCSSPEKGAAVRKVCSKGCIGCGLCVKAEGGVSMTMSGAIARIEYDKAPVANPEAVAGKCPSKCLVNLDLSDRGERA